jgi:hypothetical protein
VSIPAETTITVPTGCDGTINAPTIKDNSSVSVPVDSNQTADVSLVIEIGYSDVKLVFDKAARVLLPGQAGKYVGYSRGGTFTSIDSVCSEDSQPAGDALPAEGDCKINSGSDLVIWTKHFTQFVTYTVTTVTVSQDSSSAGGGGGIPWIIGTRGGTLGFSAPVIPPQIPSQPTQIGQIPSATAPSAVSVPPVFTTNLGFGMKGVEVKRLQQILNADSDTRLAKSGHGSPGNETYFFGFLTKASVIKFQEKYFKDILAFWNLIKGTGFVGTTTRGKLNELMGAYVDHCAMPLK